MKVVVNMIAWELVVPVAAASLVMEIGRLWYHRKVIRTIKVIKD